MVPFWAPSLPNVLPPSRYCPFKELTCIGFSVNVKGLELPETLEFRVDLVIQAVVEDVRASVAPQWSLLRAHGMFSLRLSESSSPLKALLGTLLVYYFDELLFETRVGFSESILNSNDLI